MNAIDWLNYLKAKADAATGGEWMKGEMLQSGTVVRGHNMIIDCRHAPDEGCFGNSNATFIAAANPQTVQRLVAMLEWFARDESCTMVCPMPDGYACKHKRGEDCTHSGTKDCEHCWIQAAYEATAGK